VKHDTIRRINARKDTQINCYKANAGTTSQMDAKKWISSEEMEKE
jgi:hypothetical protein